MKHVIPCVLLASTALLLGSCGQSPALAEAPTGTVSLHLSFPQRAASQSLAAQGVPSTVDQLVVKVWANGQALKFDDQGKLVKSGKSALTYTAASPNPTLTLPTGLKYTFEFSAQNSNKNNVELAWTSNTFTLTSEGQSVTPALKTIIASVALTREGTATAYNAGGTYGAALSVTAPDGSPVSAMDYTADYALNSATDATIKAYSARGVLVSLGNLDATVSATVSGLNAEHKQADFTTEGTKFSIATGMASVSSDLVAPVISSVSRFSSRDLWVEAMDNSGARGVSTVVVYRGTEMLGSGTYSDPMGGESGSNTLWASLNADVVAGDTLTVYAYDAAGNESEPKVYTVPQS